MAAHHDEQEELDAIKRWWHENAAFVIAGLVIGVAVVVGWRAWNWHLVEQAEQASALYAEVKTAVEAKDATKAATSWGKLSADYAKTPYAANGGLLLAKAQVEAGDLPGARVTLEWAVAHGVDAQVVLLARTRLARVHIAEGAPDKALAVLAGVDGGAFTGLVEDARGDAELAQGKPEDARKSWTAALAASEGNLADRQLIELKLAALGPAPVAAEPAAPAAAPATGKSP